MIDIRRLVKTGLNNPLPDLEFPSLFNVVLLSLKL